MLKGHGKTFSKSIGAKKFNQAKLAEKSQFKHNPCCKFNLIFFPYKLKLTKA